MIIDETKPINKNLTSNLPDNSVHVANKIIDKTIILVSICL